MRCFIAIDINAKIKKQIEDICSELKTQINADDLRYVNWANIKQTHVTLKFFPKIKDDVICPMLAVVEKVAKKYEPFQMKLENLGFFGNKKANTIWLGASDEATMLSTIHDELNDEFGPLGLAGPRRKFTAHVTLARIKNSAAAKSIADIVRAKKTDYQTSEITVNEINVYESQLTETEAIHTNIASFKLALL